MSMRLRPIADLRELHMIERFSLEYLVGTGKRGCRIPTPSREHRAQHFGTTHKKIGIALPIVQAPMAGISAPALAAAVSKRGEPGIDRGGFDSRGRALDDTRGPLGDRRSLQLVSNTGASVG